MCYKNDILLVNSRNRRQNPTPCPHRQPLIQAFRYITGAINHPLSLRLYCSPCLFTPIFMTPLSPRCTCAHFLSTCSRLATRLRLAPSGPVARRPFQRGAWQGRVESRSPRPLLPLLFAMPGAPLDSSHFAQHALCQVPTPLSTAMHETLYWPAAAVSATQTKFQDRALGK